MATRGSSSHVHPDYETRADHHRYEERVSREMEKLEGAVDRLTNRVTLLMGAIGLIVFVLPIIAPFVRGVLGLP